MAVARAAVMTKAPATAPPAAAPTVVRRPGTSGPRVARAALGPTVDPRFRGLLQRLAAQHGTVEATAGLPMSSPGDAAEREAEQVAERVMATPPARPAARTGAAVQRAAVGAVAGRAPADVSDELRGELGGGASLPASARAFMEPRFGTDFGGVKVHVGERAARLAARLGARAFTYANHVFFGRGAYDPGGAEGRRLLAHELTHVIQQGAAAPAREGRVVGVSQRVPAQVQRLGLSDILDGLAELAANVPGYTLLTVIIGRNPINMRVVERSAVNVLRAFMGLIPGGEILFQVLDRYGVIQRLGAWVNQQTAAMGLTFQSVRDAFTRFTDSLSWTDIFSPGDVWRRAESIFTPTIMRIRDFVGGLISQAVTWLKETFMEPLSGFCREIPGYTLVTVLLGRDPFTNAAVPRTAMNVVRAFAEFIPGGTEKVNQLVESRALERAYQWFVQETQARNLTWARVTGTFAQAWNSLRLEDVLHPIDTLRRIVGMFTPLMRDLVGFAGAALMKLLELIFEAVMGAGGARVLAIMKRARSTFLIIIQNPVGFLGNLLRGVGQGVRQFRDNILTHLRDGVIAWLTGPVARAGVQMPERWDARGIIGFVLQILGLTWARVRQKLVRLMGEPAVAALETGFQLIQDIRQRGFVQALRDRVTEFFGQLREGALGAIRTFIQQRLVMAGVTQLVSMLNPVGAVIQAIIKTYTTVQFFIQRINQILDVVESVVNSVSAIASGAVGQAASFIERTMARTIPILLDFLARFIGLGDVGGHVQRTIQGLQGRVDQMLDRAVDWIRTQAQRLGRAVMGAVRGRRTPEDIQRDLNRAQRELPGRVNSFLANDPSKLRVRAQLLLWRVQYGLTALQLQESGEGGRFIATINPTFAVGDGVSVYVGDAELLRSVNEISEDVLTGSRIIADQRRNLRDQANTQGGDAPVLEARRARGVLGFASLMRSSTGASPRAPVLIIGQDAAGNDLQVRFRRFQNQRDPNRIVTSAAPGFQAPRPYVGSPNSFGTVLPNGPQTPLTAQGLQALSSGQPVPAGINNPEVLGEMHATLFGQEVARSPESLAHSTMLVDLMAQGPQGGGVDLVQGLNMHPATMAGAGPAQRELREAVASGGPLRGSAEMQEARRRAVQLVTAWIRSQIQAGEGPVTRSRRAFLMWVRRAIRERLETYVRTGA